jgi:predicted phosphodiesterase
MSKKTRSQEVADQYIKICRKLNKMASARDCQKFGLTIETIKYHFGGKINNLKDEALKIAPYLEDLFIPQELVMGDIEKLRLTGTKKDVNKSNKQIIEAGNILDYIQQFSENVFKGRINGGKKKKKIELKRVHTLMLSDLHIGADIEKDETGALDFGKVEESRRVAAVVREAIDYKPQYRKNTKLVVALLGDIIENSMHDARTGAVLSEQICRAIHILIQAITALANEYEEVDVECATGNHDRNMSRHQNRAVHQKFDSYATIIYYAVKSALANVKNVKVNIPKTPMSSYNVFGMRIGYTHADTVINPGGIYSTVNVKALENQVNKMNASLPHDEEYAAILYGHTHIGHTVQLSNGTVLIGNGGLPPPDPFAVSIGTNESNSGQWIFESVPGHAVGDMRYIKVNAAIDQDKSLDKIIKPWEKF